MPMGGNLLSSTDLGTFRSIVDMLTIQQEGLAGCQKTNDDTPWIHSV